MKFRVDRDVLADAVAWTARTLPVRPPVAVLAGMLIEADDNFQQRTRRTNPPQVAQYLYITRGHRAQPMITLSPVWTNDFVEGGFIELSDGTSTNSLDHVCCRILSNQGSK